MSFDIFATEKLNLIDQRMYLQN